MALDPVQTGNFIGGTAGKFAGAAAGSAAGVAAGSALGSVLPGIGTLVGGFLGSKVGGLFGDKDYPYALAVTNVNPETNRFEVRNTIVLDGVQKSEAVKMGEALSGILNEILDLIAPAKVDRIAGSEGIRIGFASGRSAKTGSGFFEGGDASFVHKGARVKNLDTYEQAVDAAIRDFFTQAKFTGVDPKIESAIKQGLEVNKTNAQIIEDIYNIKNPAATSASEQNAAKAAAQNGGGVIANEQQTVNDPANRLLNQSGNNAITLAALGAVAYILVR